MFVATQAEVGIQLGIGASTLHKWIRRGCPGKTEQGYDVEAISAWRKSNEKPPRQSCSLDDSIKREKLRLLILKRKAQQGQYLLKDDVFRSWSKFSTDCRVLLETLPEALALLVPEGALRDLVRVESRRITDDALRSLVGTEQE